MMTLLKNKFTRLRNKITLKGIAKFFAVLLSLYYLVTYFAVNPIAQKLIPRMAEKSLASQATVGRVQFDPFRLKATIDDFQLASQSGEPLAQFKQLVVDFELSGMFDFAWKFKRFGIVEPQVSVDVASNGVMNWDGLIAKVNEGEPPPPSDTIPRLIVEKIAVSGGKVKYADANRPDPIETVLTPLNFELDGFSTVPKDRGDYFISAAFAKKGGTLKWKGDMGVNPVASKGVVALDGIKISKVLELVKGLALPVTINEGVAATSFNYDFSLPKTIPTLAIDDFKLSVQDAAGKLAEGGDVSLAAIELSAPTLDFVSGEQPMLRIDQLDVNVETLNVDQQEGMRIALKNSAARLSQLDVDIQETPQVAFSDFNLTLNELLFNQQDGMQLSLQDSALSFPQFNFGVESSAAPEQRVALADVNLTFNGLQLKQADGTQVSFKDSIASVPQLSYALGETPQLAFSDFNLKLNELGFNQQDGLQLTLKESAASLPQFNLALAETTQYGFSDLNIRLLNLNLNQKNQFAVVLPKTEMKAASANLAEDQLRIKELVTFDVKFSGAEELRAARGRAPKSLATLKAATIKDGTVSLAERKVSVQSVLFSGLNTAVIKQANQAINWAKAFERKGASAKSAPKKVKADAEQPAWQVALAKVGLNNSNIHIEDNSVPTPIVLDVQGASLEVKKASLDMSKTLPIKAAFKVKQGGRFSTKGKMRPSPFKADLGLRLSQLSLKTFAPYVNQVALLKLSDGSADVSGKLHVEQKKEMALNFNGQFDVKQLKVLEEAGNKPFLSWDSLRSDQLKVSLMPNQLSMKTLQIVKPAGKFIINPDKSINLTQVMRSSAGDAAVVVSAAPAEAEKKAAPVVANSNSLIKNKQVAVTAKPETVKKVAPDAKKTAAGSDDFPMSIDVIRINDAKLEFADLSLTPQFGANIHSLNGVINGLATKTGKVTKLELNGKVDEYGSARISGALQPFNVTDFTDVKLAFVNLDMNKMTPYSGKFAGRKIDSGKLSVDLEYKIKQHELAGTNKFVINKLKLGEKVDSADAADLPLDLAIAILQDGDGVIDLDLPISGSLDDPEFSFGGIVWKAFGNVITKIVTAPFKLLGKLFGGDGEDFDGIAFDAGVSEIAPPELEKLLNVSGALAKRQALSLGIVPTYNLALDTPAIKQATYRQQVADEMDVELAPGQKPGSVDLENEEVQDAVDALYNKLTKKGLLKRVTAKLKKPEEGHYEKAQASLIESVEVTTADLEQLASARAETIQAALLESGIAPARIAIQEVAGDKAGEAVKVELTLGTEK